MTTPMAAYGAYSPMIITAGTFECATDGPLVAHLHQAHYTYQLAFWRDMNVVILDATDRQVLLPKTGAMLIPPETVYPHAYGRGLAGWIHFRAMCDAVWSQMETMLRTAGAHSRWLPLDRRARQPDPKTVWGHDLSGPAPDGMQRRASAMCFRMVGLWRRHASDDVIEANGLLVRLINRWIKAEHLQETRIAPKSIPITNDLFAFRVQENIWGATSPLAKVITVADQVGVSSTTLRRRMRQRGMPAPGAALRYMRMNKARSLLQNTNTRIADIARECGYSCASTLRRAFMQVFGVPPSACRKRRRARRRVRRKGN